MKKTFPLELDDQLHKSLKHKAIESDKTLHEYIIDLLATNVREQSPVYGAPAQPAKKRTK